jgi:hypothetical protein
VIGSCLVVSCRNGDVCPHPEAADVRLVSPEKISFVTSNVASVNVNDDIFNLYASRLINIRICSLFEMLLQMSSS